MMSLNLTGLVCALVLTAPVEPQKPEVKPATAAEVQDLVLLHEEGPVRIRLRISNGDKSVFARWHEHLDRWFLFADRNRNTVIEESEFERVPNVTQMQYMLQNGQFYAAQQLGANAAFTLKDVDLDADGKIDRHEYYNYYLTTSAGPLLVQAGYSQAAALGLSGSNISDALFRALDANRDGRLSKQEMTRAGELLARFDTNDDEIVSAQELNSSLAQAFVPGFNPGVGRTAGFALNLVPVPREASELRVTARLKFAKDLLVRCDADRDGTLAAREFRIPEAEFTACDANGDKRLDALELVKWLVHPPHMTIHARMDTLVAGDSAIEIQGEGVTVGKVALDGLNFRYADATIQFDRNTTVANRGFNAGANMKQYFVNTFNAADTQKTGRLSVEEINRNPQTVYLRQHSKWLDADSDGFITLAEIEEFIQLTSGGTGSQLAVGFLDQGRGLFEILDTETDMALTVSELRKASKSLESYLKPGQDSLGRTDIPRRYHLVVANNAAGGAQMRMGGQMPVVMPRQPGVNPQAGQRKGPLWFQKMDVNLDNHISPREFLGPMSAFQKMDSDGDGLIGHQEAEAFVPATTSTEGRRAEPIREAPTEK